MQLTSSFVLAFVLALKVSKVAGQYDDTLYTRDISYDGSLQARAYDDFEIDARGLNDESDLENRNFENLEGYDARGLDEFEEFDVRAPKMHLPPPSHGSHIHRHVFLGQKPHLDRRAVTSLPDVAKPNHKKLHRKQTNFKSSAISGHAKRTKPARLPKEESSDLNEIKNEEKEAPLESI